MWKNVYVYKQIFVFHGLEDKVCNMKLNPKTFNPVTISNFYLYEGIITSETEY